VIGPFRENDLILFTGDSITDCNRNRRDPESLGLGYVGSIASQLWMQFPELDLQIRNTGISGDRTCDLLRRWESDCIRLKPNWVSILIGVNNTWRKYDSEDPTDEAVFESELRNLLNQVREKTEAKLILCTPFLLNTTPAISAMREDLNPKIEIIRKLAGEFNAVLIDFEAVFNAAEEHAPPEYWAEDGVHPTTVGHCLMAETWMDSVADEKC